MLLTWHWRLGHLLFNPVVELAQSGASRVVTTDVLVKIPGHDVCTASAWDLFAVISKVNNIYQIKHRVVSLSAGIAIVEGIGN